MLFVPPCWGQPASGGELNRPVAISSSHEDTKTRRKPGLTPRILLHRLSGSRAERVALAPNRPESPTSQAEPAG